MLNVLGENYYVDFDKIENYIDMSDPSEFEVSGATEMRVNIVKFELVKMMLDVVLSENAEVDEVLGLKSNSTTLSVPFKIAFNSLLNKNLINRY